MSKLRKSDIPKLTPSKIVPKMIEPLELYLNKSTWLKSVWYSLKKNVQKSAARGGLGEGYGWEGV